MAKASLDEIGQRTAAAERSAKLAAPKAREFHQNGCTLR